MRKILFFALCAALLSCSKQESAHYQEVVFEYNLVEEYSMTKTIDHSAIKGIISNAIPSTIRPAFYLNGDKSQGINVELGSSITMKVGTYSVEWANCPNSIANVIDGETYFAKTPQLNISAEVKVVPGTTEYTIPATFKSFAIVADATEVSRVQYLTIGGDFVDIDFFTMSGDNMIIFVNGEFTDTGVLKLCLIPADNTRKTTYIFLSNKVESVGEISTVHIDYGRYYVIHPEAITEVGSLFNLDIPEWDCGNEEI